jgi:hypothetical protein
VGLVKKRLFFQKNSKWKEIDESLNSKKNKNKGCKYRLLHGKIEKEKEKFSFLKDFFDNKQVGAGLLDLGLNWSGAMTVIVLGNLVLVGPMILNAHAGTKYGTERKKTKFD